MKTSVYSVFAFLLIVLGFFILIIISIDTAFNDWSFNIDPDLASKYGSLIGGLVGSLFSLAGLLLIFENLRTQKKSFFIQQLENRFFELLKYHKENVTNLSYRIPYRDTKFVKGQSVFVDLKKEFEEILAHVRFYSRIDGMLEGDDKDKQEIDIAYTMFFYGVKEETIATIKGMLGSYNKDLLDFIIDKLSERKPAFNCDEPFYEGHEYRLGHYYRHLFTTFMFLEKSNHLSESEKYYLGKILRSQLTTYEQALLFYSSFSREGINWIKYNLISKYQLIKNLPPRFVLGIDPKKYFPGITFEWEEEQ